ncbi:hypothetical protein CCB80_02760 [Armatimonadetes bacterium Uphvl-Ar1]|nr:hypothetical protein CCB80_02760 [Armatimonadetes bacterium Uphvl-Ar1]
MTKRMKKHFNEITISVENLLSCGWEDVFAQSSKWEIDKLYAEFNKKSRELSEKGEVVQAECLAVLGHVASMFLTGKRNKPLDPIWQFKDSRGGEIDDYTDNQAEILFEFAQKIDNLELVARIADIYFLRISDHRAAALAAQSYLNIAKEHLTEESWVNEVQRLSRAITLNLFLGKKRKETLDCINYVQEMIISSSSVKGQGLVLVLIQLLRDHKVGDQGIMVEASLRCGDEQFASGDLPSAFDYYMCAFDIVGASGTKDQKDVLLEKMVQSCLKIAEFFHRTEYNSGAAIVWIERAIAAVNRVGKNKELKAKLINELKSAQKKSSSNMQKSEMAFKIEGELKAKLDNIENLSFEESIQLIAELGVPTPLSTLKELAESQDEIRLANIFDRRLIGEDGRTEAIIPGQLPGEEGNDESIRLRMLAISSEHQAYKGFCAKYGLHKLSEKFDLAEYSFDWLLDGNLLVQDARVELWEKALKAGLQSDFIMFAHIIIPQLEHSIREYVASQGHVVTYVKPNGTEDVYLLHDLMARPEFLDLFGQELAFDLRSLLVERAGSNLRNDVSHGLVSARYFNSPSFFYLYSATLHLLIIAKRVVE